MKDKKQQAVPQSEAESFGIKRKVLIYISTLENLRKAGVGKSSNQSFLFY